MLRTAKQKVMAVYTAESTRADCAEPALVLAADTVAVTRTGRLLEKPRDAADHVTMLRSLRDGGRHTVCTAVVAMAPLRSARAPGYTLQSAVEETVVRFGPDVSDALIEAYVRTGEGADKAGGYAVQGVGAVLVDRIEGSYDNVVGLPLRATLTLIEQVLAEDEASDEDGAAFVSDEDN